ncbi:hypothetical protein GQ53DRAFT_334749 [Thozetella sp. PMI_491]|nr:hypothetical protein GQ53DRAFT_334749 [Thozetella sp. PMI_491]
MTSLKVALLSGGLGLLSTAIAQEQTTSAQVPGTTLVTVTNTSLSSSAPATTMGSTTTLAAANTLSPTPAPLSPLTPAAIGGITVGAIVLAVVMGLLAYYYGYRRARGWRLAAMRRHRLSISCQGLSSPVHLSSGKIVSPTLELSPVGSPERKS